MSKTPTDWYKYFRQKTIDEMELFSNPKNVDYGKEFDRIFRLVQRNYGSLESDLKLEKLTYQFVTGQKQRITARNIESFQRKFTEKRMQKFSENYPEIKEYLDWYILGEITLDELNELIKDFKDRNTEYIKHYGK